ncbi:MAG TPA: class I adenylate-forming enzyme family protein, partial [Candidatus Binatia bacterium]|nr:class I adenylate-forming enzyme family protein [Candidatus Binatia bacterium]
MAKHIDSIGFFAAELLDQAARKHPNKTAIIDKEEELSFSVLNARVHALAGHLHSEGIKQSDRVGVLLPNCAAIPLIYFASQKIGAVSVLLDARLRGKELRDVLCDADLKLLVVHKQLISEVANVLEELTPVSIWIVQ